MRGCARSLILILALFLSACGGGGGGGGAPGTPSGPTPVIISDADAARLLNQATFGVTDADIDLVKSKGYSTWVSDQLALAPSASHLDFLDRRLTEKLVTNSKASLSSTEFYQSFWFQAAGSPDQLRQRVKFALSQIFVISLADTNVDARGAASYYDMLGQRAFGNYRDLLQAVTLHPMMGIYLTSLGNQKEDAATGKMPDENYAREVMQLMSIGLYKMNPDGSAILDSSGALIPTYTPQDISGLAKVFTGMSWYSPTPSATTFKGGARNANASVTPMIFYPAYHSTSAKSFLGTTIAASATADPEGDIKIALDRIYNDPNVGPFMARRLIQNLVTSNPSPAYIGRVAAVFNNNGSGVRGDMAAVVKAVLLDSEARNSATAAGATYGKLREPIVRLGNWMRSFGAVSASGNYLVDSTSTRTSLAQSPLSAASVFNFYRPGFVPPNSRLAQQNLTGPEFQIADEISVAGYANFMQSTIGNGTGTGQDVKAAYTQEMLLAKDPAALVERMNRLLYSGQMSATLRSQIINAVTGVALPTGTPTQAQTDAALLNRAKLAVFLSMVSPEYMVQK
jgi:uncharacterized protein (DUF1800 family)